MYPVRRAPTCERRTPSFCIQSPGTVYYAFCIKLVVDKNVAVPWGAAGQPQLIWVVVRGRKSSARYCGGDGGSYLCIPARRQPPLSDVVCKMGLESLADEGLET